MNLKELKMAAFEQLLKSYHQTYPQVLGISSWKTKTKYF